MRRLFEQNLPDLHQHIEHTVVREAYAYCHQNQVQTARLLGISRNVLRARLIEAGELRVGTRPPSSPACRSLPGRPQVGATTSPWGPRPGAIGPRRGYGWEWLPSRPSRYQPLPASRFPRRVSWSMPSPTFASSSRRFRGHDQHPGLGLAVRQQGCLAQGRRRCRRDRPDHAAQVPELALRTEAGFSRSRSWPGIFTWCSRPSASGCRRSRFTG